MSRFICPKYGVIIHTDYRPLNKEMNNTYKPSSALSARDELKDYCAILVRLKKINQNQLISFKKKLRDFNYKYNNVDLDISTLETLLSKISSNNISKTFYFYTFIKSLDEHLKNKKLNYSLRDNNLKYLKEIKCNKTNYI